MEALYPRLLQDTFSQLSPLLQRMHQEIGLSWHGCAEVVWSRHALLKSLLHLAGMPRAGQAVPLQLRLEQRGELEIWQRSFAGRPMRSKQCLRRNKLYETAGPWGLELECSLQNGSLTLQNRRTRFFGLPLPAVIGLAVTGKEWEENERFHFDVAISLQWGQRYLSLLHYAGWLSPVTGGVQHAHH